MAFMIHYEKVSNDVFKHLEEAKHALYHDSNIIFAYLFGGLAKGAKSALSDIDIAVYIRDTSAIAEYKLNLFLKLSDILHTSEIDIVILNTAPESIAGRVLLSKKLLVDKEPYTRHIYESVTLRKYYDFSIKEKEIFYRRYRIGRYATHSS